MKIILLVFLILCPITLYAQNDYTIDLSGEWKMIRGDNLDYASPEFNDSYWKTVNLPRKDLMPSKTSDLFPANKDDTFGYFWIRKTFYVEDLSTTPLLFQVGEIMNADVAYLNGIIIGETGVFPPNFKSGWSNFRSYKIPEGYLFKGRNVISIRVYFDAESWISPPIRVIDYRRGSAVKMIRDFFLINFLESLFFVLTAFSAFFLVFYFYRRQEKEYLLFSIAALLLAFSITLQFIENHYAFIPISSIAILKLNQSSLILFTPFLFMFNRYFLQKKISIKVVAATLIVPVIGSVIIIFSVTRYGVISVRNALILTIPVYIALTMFDSIRASFKGNSKSFIMIAAFLPATFLAFHDIASFVFNLFDDGIALFVYALPLLVIIFAFHFIFSFIKSLNENEKLKTSFSRFVPVEFINIIGKKELWDIELGDSTEMEITVLFTDIRSFSAISERMSPKKTFNLLNSYLQWVVPLIKKNGGFIDKYMGDGIMALFPNSPKDAVLTSIEIREGLASFNYDMSNNQNHIDVGCGINFGKLMLGTIGEKSRMQGTVIADSVNLASRLESLTRYYGSDILISDKAIKRINEKKNNIYRMIDVVCVSGKKEIIKIYEVLHGYDIGINRNKCDNMKIFDKAVAAYQKGDFVLSSQLFNKLHKITPDDKIIPIYFERIRQAKKLISQGGEWSYIHIFQSK